MPRAAEAMDRAGAARCSMSAGDVETIGVEERAVVLGDADDGVALVAEKLGGVGADVAET